VLNSCFGAGEPRRKGGTKWALLHLVKRFLQLCEIIF
jgi:hypothetical protein